MIEPLGAYGYRAPRDVEQTYRDVLDRSLDIFTSEGAVRVAVADRIAAAEPLGRVGTRVCARPVAS